MILIFLVLVGISVTSSQIVTSDCGETFSCFLQPVDCVDNSCKFIFKWRNNSDSNIDFVLSANFGSSSNKWVGIGFSSDQKMGSDSVVICRSTNAIETYYNNRHDPVLVDSNNPSVGISNQIVNANNNWLTCKFSRQVRRLQYSTFFDLSNNYYILAGYGAITSGGLKQHDKSSYSGMKADFFSTTNVLSGSRIANMQTQNSLKFLFIIAFLCHLSIYWKLS